MVVERFFVKYLHYGSNCVSSVPEVFFVFQSLKFCIMVASDILTKEQLSHQGTLHHLEMPD